MPRPIVAIVGRPNVGKSTLFNRLIGERRAVTHDVPGTTRDRLYGTTDWNGREFTIVDTGGIGLTVDERFMSEVAEQADEAMREADAILFLVDAQSGPSGADLELAERLRRARKPVVLGANKAESPRARLNASEFYQLGLGEPLAFSGQEGIATGDLLDALVQALPPLDSQEEPIDADCAIAIVGRPNVGKSSLLNALTGERRSIVSEIPGTTRDTIDTLVEYHEQRILLIDTAGIRRRGRVERGVEQFSVMRAVRAVERSDVVALVIDATEGVTAQDTHVAGYAQEQAKGLIVVVNKWDLVEKDDYTVLEFGRRLERDLNFVAYAPYVFISAVTGQRVQRVLDLALEVRAERAKRVPTAQLNQVVRDAVAAHRLSERGKALKVLYATQPAIDPPTFVFFVNEPEIVHFSYRRYLENRLREAFGFKGTAIRLVFRGRDEDS
ncbi:MAG: ribosome biogenesis GTPase Der [Chloroflexi bacterium]|nr:ribosome biogenesis GTPase Der [Chloroflexota bacterium]